MWYLVYGGDANASDKYLRFPDPEERSKKQQVPFDGWFPARQDKRYLMRQ